MPQMAMDPTRWTHDPTTDRERSPPSVFTDELFKPQPNSVSNLEDLKAFTYCQRDLFM